MRGAAPFSAARAAVNTRPGAYDREIVRHLGDYVDRDTELYAAAVHSSNVQSSRPKGP